MINKLTLIEDDFLEKICKESINDLNVFYEINWTEYLPRIIVVDSRKTIDSLKGKKTESWLIGWSEGKTIYVLDRNSFEKESDHAYDPATYSAFIKHELSHSFYNVVSGGQQKPIWLNEGVAIYTSGQNNFKKVPAAFNKFLEFYDRGGKDVYGEAGFFVQTLVEKFGKQKLLDLIKESKNLKTKEEFENFFVKEYGFSLDYKEINEKKLI